MHVKTTLLAFALTCLLATVTPSPVPQFLGVPNTLLDPRRNPQLIVDRNGRVRVDPNDVPRLIDGAVENQFDRVNRQIDAQRGTPGGGGFGAGAGPRAPRPPTFPANARDVGTRPAGGTATRPTAPRPAGAGTGAGAAARPAAARPAAARPAGGAKRAP
ncbi:hypothetical protein BKA69DRAFT_1086495 [Paraphysoderma sedebokerense]|nr:hypothetical protein BKA69DRAFT_1086495 [Paraphysoderma sedebokerense]